MIKEAKAFKQHSIDKVINNAQLRTKSLKTRMANIIKYQSNYDLILRRFDNKSTFDRVSLWYWDKPWYEKGMMGLLKSGVVGFSFAIHFTGLAILLFTIIASVTALLAEHGIIYKAREDKTRSDIKEIEQKVLEEIDELQTLEQSLTQSLVSINKILIDLSHTNQLLQKNVGHLEVKNIGLHKNVAKLEASINQFKKTTERLKSQLDERDKQLLESNQSLNQKSEDILNLTNEVGQLTENLLLSTQDLSDIHKVYLERLSTLKSLSSQLSQGVGFFSHKTPSNAPNTNKDIEEILQQANALLKK